MKAKFNVIDVVIILLVIAIGAGGYMFLSGRSESAASTKNVKVRYCVELTMKEAYATELFHEGDTVSVGEKEKLPATVVGVEVSNARQSTFDTLSGEYLITEVPGRYDIAIWLESEGTESDGQVSVDGTAVRVGLTELVKGREGAGYGYIIDMSTEEE